ncbi:MAG TPA: transcriptional regulator [Nitrospiraceae bacterium]|nr:MAG: transcriptional regulator [Nitrospirae bacterium GWA2_46_11]OGW24956.1 MAG: transcriptional regulator [Nitrospirae bacterium GWB2_47_37]HAK88220.1 transcriptional regulator [Nitrospiraceae bacterium]HCZ12989.1 transcriptional regulator [Nitrospiraceae bacterium]
MTKYKKGTVVLVLFPNSDLITAKHRPAVIVQVDELNTGLEQAIVAMVTSNLFREGHPSRIRLNKDSEEGKNAGLLTDSIIMTDNLATVRFFEIDRIIGSLSGIDKLDNALRVTFGLK